MNNYDDEVEDYYCEDCNEPISPWDKHHCIIEDKMRILEYDEVYPEDEYEVLYMFDDEFDE